MSTSIWCVDIGRDARRNFFGRTGRVDKLGKAITMVFSREEKYLNEIENYTGNKIEEIIQINEDDIKNGKEKFENLQKNLLKNKKPNKLEKNTNDEVTKIYLNVGKKKKIRVVDIVKNIENFCRQERQKENV